MSGSDPRRTEVRELFTRLISAYGVKDFARFAQHVAPDAVFDWPFLPLGEFPDEVRSRDQFIAISQAGMAGCDGYHHVVDRFYDMLDPDWLLVEYHSQTVFASGQPYGNKYLGILRFEGDQVVYWREYVNPLPIMQAYGMGFANAAVAS